MRQEFTGYRRESSRIGVRNHVTALPTSVTSSYVTRGIAAEVGAWARATLYQMGASQPNETQAQAERVLVDVGRNPNVSAAPIIEFGTEDIDAADLANRIARDGKPVETLSVHEVGGMVATLQHGRTALGSLNKAATGTRHESANADELVAGVEYGGSDATPGIAASPAAGDACDRLVVAGGTASFSEMPEFIGAEYALTERCIDERTRRRLLGHVERREVTADLIGVDLRGAQPSPGNQGGGLMVIEEKNLGAVPKGGTTPVRGIIDYTEHLPVGGGLVLINTPGHDVEGVVGRVASGAQTIVLTTGRGNTIGDPVAPVMRVTGNPWTRERMRSNMGVNAGAVVEGDTTTSEADERVFDEVLAVAGGKRTGTETRRTEEFAVTEVHPRELAEVQGK